MIKLENPHNCQHLWQPGMEWDSWICILKKRKSKTYRVYVIFYICQLLWLTGAEWYLGSWLVVWMNSSSLGTYEQLFGAQNILKMSPVGVREGLLSEVADCIPHSQRGFSVTNRFQPPSHPSFPFLHSSVINLCNAANRKFTFPWVGPWQRHCYQGNSSWFWFKEFKKTGIFSWEFKGIQIRPPSPLCQTSTLEADLKVFWFFWELAEWA